MHCISEIALETSTDDGNFGLKPTGTDQQTDVVALCSLRPDLYPIHPTELFKSEMLFLVRPNLPGPSFLLKLALLQAIRRCLMQGVSIWGHHPKHLKQPLAIEMYDAPRRRDQTPVEVAGSPSCQNRPSGDE